MSLTDIYFPLTVMQPSRIIQIYSTMRHYPNTAQHMNPFMFI